MGRLLEQPNPGLRPKNKRCLPKSSVLICYKHKPRIDIALRLGGTRASLKSTTHRLVISGAKGKRNMGSSVFCFPKSVKHGNCHNQADRTLNSH